MNTVLVSGAVRQVGKTTVVKALQAYWQRYYSEQILSTITIPGMKSCDRQHEFDLAQLWRSLSQQQQDHDGVLIESEGGLGMPVTYDTTIAALARDWRLPTLLVVPVQWEAIASAVATIALARQTRLDLIGIVFNQGSPDTSDGPSGDEMADLLRSLTQVPIIGTIPFLSDPDDHHLLAQAASNLTLEKILPERLWRLGSMHHYDAVTT